MNQLVKYQYWTGLVAERRVWLTVEMRMRRAVVGKFLDLCLKI